METAFQNRVYINPDRQPWGPRGNYGANKPIPKKIFRISLVAILGCVSEQPTAQAFEFN